ncbi:DUF7351 domain-containing protein [Haloarchaeobius amylolyticus]|uniref:DUF7351 domain-containing protein n=1 Tax=Haloarchaeobius amylolyticus TaxID=1198296 RepID=UPI002271EE25|nr:hypothetical protein [Haloarchaeobius amylolyticus]
MSDDHEQAGGPREAFELLGHDLRLEILLAFLDRWRAAHTEPQRYSDLMRAVDLQDSGKFNYHLGRLRGSYLRQTEDGYVPTASATALHRAVLANRPTEAAPRSTIDSEVACPECGGETTATYEGDFFSLRCPSCDDLVDGFTYPFPKNGLDGRSDEAVLQAVYDRARTQVGLARRGQCPDCAGTTTVTIGPDALDDPDAYPVGISCETCTWIVESGFYLPLLSDAGVAAGLVDVGLPVEEAFHWEFPDPEACVVDDDPMTVELRVEAEDGTATVVVDGDLDVQSVDVTEESG